MPKSYDDIQDAATRANSLMKGLLIILRDEASIDSAYYVAESIAELTAELVNDLDIVNRPGAET